ncbi:ribosomal RNA large subunit methyltransferase N [Desulfovibrio ferrophilus]|uniref:Probable dual-specificity RNA methyltransferase RlmN n=2 Tax=Desulfovibrio ferrophilus TaxID=241368 RepID=A0A2Z6B227_9BACT|nr:ribosomal RNA large subunit methyltransferase N [Desulfovibrio ferrophilus]
MSSVPASGFTGVKRLSIFGKRRKRKTMKNLCNMSLDQLRDLVTGLGEPAYRAEQVWQWVWDKGVQRIEEMTNLSKDLRTKLAQAGEIRWPEIAEILVSSDTTVKFMLRLDDGALVETVLIPERTHTTQCLSTQVGCAMGCSFCSTGDMGFTRNMTMAEILGQVLVARQYLKDQGREIKELRNLVFMGMGEPLLNLDELMRSLAVLNSETGLGFSSRRITVSTVGVLKGLEVLGDSGLAMLAVSLHAPTQQLREQIMPTAAKAVPLDELMPVLDRYPLRPRQRITYEYIMLKGVNDKPEHAKGLVRLLGQRKAKVNLIAYNAGPDAPYQAPARMEILTFEKILHVKGLTATIRSSKGQDISAACGQLKADYIRRQLEGCDQKDTK